jgi:tryptophanyl-tRNA synthetase
VFFYRQSDIPEIPELTWLLTCVAGKGLLNRAHAYKARSIATRGGQLDADAGITAGLFMYPVLMAADILLFNAHKRAGGPRPGAAHRDGARFRRSASTTCTAKHFTLPEAAIENTWPRCPASTAAR